MVTQGIDRSRCAFGLFMTEGGELNASSFALNQFLVECLFHLANALSHGRLGET